MYAGRKLKYMISFITVLLALGFAGLSNANAEQPKLITIIGEIDKIGEDYLIVHGKRVDLVDMEYRGKHYTTNVFDAHDNPMEFSELSVGNWIKVLGADSKEGAMCASAIYYLEPSPPEPR